METFITLVGDTSFLLFPFIFLPVVLPVSKRATRTSFLHRYVNKINNVVHFIQRRYFW